MTIAQALAAAQAEMKNPPLDSVNPHFKSKFASLAGLLHSCKPVLAKHGIALVQELKEADGGVACVTHLLHESGSVAYGPAFFPANKQDAQGYGSACTYARRYTLAAVLGLVGEEDDDANAATATAHDPITKGQAADLEAMIEEVGADKAGFLAYMRAESLENIPAGQYRKAVAALEAKRRAGVK